MFHLRYLRLLAPMLTTAVLLACGDDEQVMSVYRLVPVSTRDIVVSAFAAGTVEPIQTVEVKSKASGEIMEVAVRVGQLVRRDDLLVRVDQRVPRNAVVQAEADLQVAKAEFANAASRLERAESLHDTEAITEQEYEDARLAFATAEARNIRAERTLEDARIAFEDTEVRASLDGVILSRHVEVGTVIQSASFGVSGGAVLLTMANLDTVQVRTLVDETDIGKLSIGLPVTITVEAYPNQPFQGRVLMVEPQAVLQQNVTMFPVLIRIPNEEGLLKPGMNAEVEIHIGDRRDVIAIPNTALRTRQDVESAAAVLGTDLPTVEEQLAAQRTNGEATDSRPPQGDSSAGRVSLGADGGSAARQGSYPGPDRSPSGPRGSLSDDSGFQFGGRYIVFVRRNGRPTAVEIRTGLTDLEFSEIIDGLSAADTVYVLPSAELVREQQQRQERVDERTQLIGGL